MAALPPALMRPADLVAAGCARLEHAPALFGTVEIVGITELSPVWRPLLHAIARHTPVRWNAGPRSVPDWLNGDTVEVVHDEAKAPEIYAVSTASAYHEAVEAMRWARELLASGMAEPADIAIASATPTEYDDHLLALRADANLDLHFVHGVTVTACREGQAAAALADILLRGLSQTRMRRLNTLLRTYTGPFTDLPEGWTRILPAGAPLSSLKAWTRLIDGLSASDSLNGIDCGPALAAIVNLLSRGIEAAGDAGETLLRGHARDIWRRALAEGPAASLDLTLETLRQDDGIDACVSACWMPANALAASPRRFVRLLGLNSARWPRTMAEDRLLSDHIVPTAELDPLPVAAADRRDFETILATTESEIVLSRARRGEDGRLLGRSTLLLQVEAPETYVPRNRVPAHAFSETDRLTARPDEFRRQPQAMAASDCWFDWLCAEITQHDGVVRPDHPVIRTILERTQSARSLRMLLRNPLGFVWRYGLGWRAPESGEDPLVLDALAMGELVHQTLDRALRTLEDDGGLADASEKQIGAAMDAAAAEVAASWEAGQAVPPPIIWRRTLDEVRALGGRTLGFRDADLADARAYGEVPFGGLEPKTDGAAPWDTGAAVKIAGTGFCIAGYIDRLDISADGRRALVRDYKTGRVPREDIVLDGGKELQRCLYAFAVRALLGEEVSIAASLLYPHEESDLRLNDPDAVLDTLAGHLRAASINLASGGAVMGVDTGEEFDDLAFALPANAGAVYRVRKEAAANERLGDATRVWDAP